MFTSLFTLTGPAAPSGAGASAPLHCLRETPSPGDSPGAHAAAAMPRRRGRGAMGKRPSRAGLRTEHSHPAVRSPEHAEDGIGSTILPTAEMINKNPVHPIGKEEITAPCGTGSLRRIRPQRSLRNVDDDCDLIGHDRHTKAVAAIDADHEDPITSCRDGSESAESVRGHDRFGLPAYRRSRITWDSGIKLSSDADYTSNEAPEVEFLEFVAPDPQGLSPLSSACLYLRTQTSMACDMFMKSLFSIFDCRYSRISGGRVTVTYGLFLAMQGEILHEPINTCNIGVSYARLNLAGATQHGRESAISESSAYVRKDMVGGSQGPIRKLDADDSAGDRGMVPCACGMVHGRGPMHHCGRHRPQIGHAVRDKLTEAAA